MDVHVPYPITEGLRLRGVDVLTAQEDAASTRPDALLLERAGSLGRVLFSQDRDFVRIGVTLQRTGEQFGGVIYVHQSKLTVGQVIGKLELIGKLGNAKEFENKVEFL